MIYGYARVYSQEQRTRAHEYLTRAHIPSEQTYIDVAGTFNPQMQPGLVELLKNANAGDTIIVERFDHLITNLRALKDFLEIVRIRGIRLTVSHFTFEPTQTSERELIEALWSSEARLAQMNIEDPTRYIPTKKLEPAEPPKIGRKPKFTRREMERAFAFYEQNRPQYTQEQVALRFGMSSAKFKKDYAKHREERDPTAPQPAPDGSKTRGRKLQFTAEYLHEAVTFYEEHKDEHTQNEVAQRFGMSPSTFQKGYSSLRDGIRSAETD